MNDPDRVHSKRVGRLQSGDIKIPVNKMSAEDSTQEDSGRVYIKTIVVALSQNLHCCGSCA